MDDSLRVLHGGDLIPSSASAVLIDASTLISGVLTGEGSSYKDSIAPLGVVLCS
jgi:hypothetical protein